MTVLAVTPSRELVLKKLRDCFPNPAAAAEALTMLDTYGTAPWHRERERVQLAILRNSAGDLETLRGGVRAAQSDYRNTLVAAEFYGEIQASSKTLPDEMAAIKKRRRESYQSWIESDDA